MYRDSATVSQLQTAANGISSADSGVKTIAGALLTLQQAPAAARQQVEDGLTAATSALSSVSSYVFLFLLRYSHILNCYTAPILL